MDLSLKVPWGYATATRTLAQVRDELLVHYHPEYVRRLIAWLASKGGQIGVGSTWRFVQPDKNGVAPEGKSFHQDQHFADGFVGACAVDVVKRSPDGRGHITVAWSDVPVQGAAEAARWGVHANVGKPGDPYPTGEQWHIQPVEIDGWQTWVNAGRPAPRANYPLPGDPPVEPIHPPEDDMEYVTFLAPGSAYAPGVAPLYQIIGGTIRWITPDVHAKLGAPAPKRAISADEAKRLVLLGGSPDGARHFAGQVA